MVSCEAAFEQYGGKDSLGGTFTPLDAIENISSWEKEMLIETKISHLALLKVIEGPEESVNASGQLLGLYGKLFVSKPKDETKKAEPQPSSPPASAAGTYKSLRGSILGLPKGRRKSRLPSSGVESSSIGSLTTAHYGYNGPATGIITDEDRTALPQDFNHSRAFLGRQESNKLRKRTSRKSMASGNASRTGSSSNSSSTQGQHLLSLHLPSRHRQGVRPNSNNSYQPAISEDVREATPSDQIGLAMTHDLPSASITPAINGNSHGALQTISSAAENMDRKNPNQVPIAPKPPPFATSKATSTNSTISIKHPEPLYLPHIQQRRDLSILVKIWLFISSLYRHASMIPDAQAATSEAKSQVELIEQSIAAHEGSSAENFSSPGYGGLKSCGQLWADVLCEQAKVYKGQKDIEKASETYENALGHDPDHLKSTVGLSKILLDIYAGPAPEEETRTPDDVPASMPTLATPLPAKSTNKSSDTTTTPDLLSRLAARDRAYGLLSALTKSGQGWDSSSSWFALSKAYELSGQIEKAIEAAEWVCTLENGKGIRPWSVTL